VSAELVFKLIFLIQFAVLLVIRVLFGLRVRESGNDSWSVNKEAVDREGKWSMVSRPMAFLGMMALVVLYTAGSGELKWLVVPLPVWLRWLGVGLGIICLPLLVWIHHTLRDYWSTSLQLRNGHSLIREGPYRRVRHPMYTALILCFTGLSLVSALWPFMLVAGLSILFFSRVAGREETMMIAQFGDEYRAYMQCTGRFLPRRFLKS
jgi:protein-S-isoprenylcysteine O-methyltransferase Ste14